MILLVPSRLAASRSRISRSSSSRSRHVGSSRSFLPPLLAKAKTASAKTAPKRSRSSQRTEDATIASSASLESSVRTPGSHSHGRSHRHRRCTDTETSHNDNEVQEEQKRQQQSHDRSAVNRSADTATGINKSGSSRRLRPRSAQTLGHATQRHHRRQQNQRKQQKSWAVILTTSLCAYLALIQYDAALGETVLSGHGIAHLRGHNSSGNNRRRAGNIGGDGMYTSRRLQSTVDHYFNKLKGISSTAGGDAGGGATSQERRRMERSFSFGLNTETGADTSSSLSLKALLEAQDAAANTATDVNVDAEKLAEEGKGKKKTLTSRPPPQQQATIIMQAIHRSRPCCPCCSRASKRDRRPRT